MKKGFLTTFIAIMAYLFPTQLYAESTIYIIHTPMFEQAPFNISFNGDNIFTTKSATIRKITTRETGRSIISYTLNKYNAEIVLNLRENSVHYVKLFLPRLWEAVTKTRGYWIFTELSKDEGEQEINNDKYTHEQDYYYEPQQ